MYSENSLINIAFDNQETVKHKEYIIKELMKLSTIDSFLPVYFNNTKSKIDIIKPFCKSCNREIESNLHRGEIRPVYKEADYRTNPSIISYKYDAFGFCKKCNRLTRYNYYIMPDLSFVIERDGNYFITSISKENVWKTILISIKKFIYKNFLKKQYSII
jgi:hypothetical protein